MNDADDHARSWPSRAATLARSARSRVSLGVVLLAALAYLPALAARPGRMPADSKLYLYLDPQRLVSDAPYAFDARQFAGWVPHQHIAYLWPSGPWYSVFDWLGVPDWIAHRLWLGTIFLAAGLGVRWAARLLGLSAAGALAAALVYQLSPYLLPYSSRTSVMLLPWAGLGWIVGLTVLAAVRDRWRHPALIALVVLTVGAVNATALLMVVPAPALWLVHAVWGGRIPWRRAVTVALRVGVLCIAVSLWWVAALVIQGRHGADVLAYSETLEAVSFTSLSTEVLRGLGYWLFYVRDPVAATTSASLDHLVSGRTVAIGFALVIVSLAGLVATRWSERRYAVLLVACGVILAVGVHPIDDRSPLMSLLVDDTRSGLALALRSSTRAVPVSLLGLALGAGALVSAIGATGPRRWERRRPRELVAVAIVAVLAVANLPALRTGGLVDPALERDPDPPSAWIEAASHLDGLPPGYRVLQLPGSEFGAFRWGFTVDQPLPGLTDRPLVTRDLLPLGSVPAMDLLYAFDDRVQAGSAEPAMIAPLARLFGVDTVWLVNDHAFERFRTARPDAVAELVQAAPGTGSVLAFGAPVVNVPSVPMVDGDALLRGGDPGPAAPVELVTITDAVPVIRAKDRVVVLVGNGDGVIDAAAAGLLDGTELIRYAGTIDDPDALAAEVDTAALVVVTDTNRARARHWRSSQDVVGFTEDGGPQPPLLRPDTADQRFELFGQGWYTTAHQRPPVTARATDYGEPFAHRPEDRPAHAVDGDPSTAWRVADRFDATGERLRLDVAPDVGHVDHLTVVQAPGAPGARRISAVDVTVEGHPAFRVDLDERSLAPPGQQIDVPRVEAPTSIDIEIVATSASGSGPEQLAAVGFATVDLGFRSSDEVVALPARAVEVTASDGPLAIVLTRDRVSPTDRWRSDPERSIERTMELAAERSFDVEATIRLDQRAPDDVLAAVLGVDGVMASQRLTGAAAAAGWAALDGRLDTAWISPFDPGDGGELSLEIDLEAGASLGTVDLVQPHAGGLSVVTGIRAVGSDGSSTEVAVPPPDPEGRSTIDLGGVGGSPVRLEVTELERRWTTDRRYGEPSALPFAIAEVSGAGIPVVEVPERIDTGCRDDLLTIGGSAVPVRIEAATDALLAGEPVTGELCDPLPTTLAAGPHTISTGSGAGFTVDRLVLGSGVGEPAPAAAPAPVATVTESGRTTRTIEVTECAAGCWLVLGEGHNSAWEASVRGRSLGDPEVVDGGFNGWWIDPVALGVPPDLPIVVDVAFGPQRTLTVALLLSLLAALGCVAIAIGGWRGRRKRPAPALEGIGHRPAFAPIDRRIDRGAAVAVVAVWAVLAALVVQPVWALAALAVGVVIVATRSARLAGWLAAVGVGACGAIVVWRVVRERPVPDAGWVLSFEDLHRPGLFLVTALLTSALVLEHDEAASARVSETVPRSDVTDNQAEGAQ